MKINKTILATAVALTLSSAAQAVVIDLFDTAQGSFDLDGVGASTATSVNGADILGGNRDFYAEIMADTDPNGGSEVGINNGELFIRNAPSVATRVQIQWDGVNTNAAFENPGVNLPPATWPDAANLAVGGLTFGLSEDWSDQDFIEVTTIFSDFGFDFQFTLFTSATEWTTVNLLANSHPGPGSVNTQIALSAFTNPGLCGLGPIVTPDGTVNFISCGSGGIVDISNITAVVLDIDTDFAITDDSVADAGGYQLALDLRVDQLETTVPVPAPIALLGMGLLAGGYFSRRKPKG